MSTITSRRHVYNTVTIANFKHLCLFIVDKFVIIQTLKRFRQLVNILTVYWLSTRQCEAEWLHSC